MFSFFIDTLEYKLTDQINDEESSLESTCSRSRTFLSSSAQQAPLQHPRDDGTTVRGGAYPLVRLTLATNGPTGNPSRLWTIPVGKSPCAYRTAMGLAALLNHCITFSNVISCIVTSVRKWTPERHAIGSHVRLGFNPSNIVNRNSRGGCTKSYSEPSTGPRSQSSQHCRWHSGGGVWPGSNTTHLQA